MACIWYHNGLVVQDINHNVNCQSLGSYKGLAGYNSWPLDRKNDEISKSLSSEAEEKWFGYYYGESYALSVVPSIEYINRYIDVCKRQGINIRVLFIQSDREVPVWEGKDLEMKFLGYDYATSQDFFSALFDDLYGNDIPYMLTKYKGVLNSNGLINNEDDLLAYVEARNLAIKEGFNIEPHGDFCRYKLSLVTTF